MVLHGAEMPLFSLSFFITHYYIFGREWLSSPGRVLVEF